MVVKSLLTRAALESTKKKRRFLQCATVLIASDDVYDFKGAAKARQEHFNKRMKQCDCLTRPFIHGIENHSNVFNACLVLTQCAITDTSAVGEPLNTL